MFFDDSCQGITRPLTIGILDKVYRPNSKLEHSCGFVSIEI